MRSSSAYVAVVSEDDRGRGATAVLLAPPNDVAAMAADSLVREAGAGSGDARVIASLIVVLLVLEDVRGTVQSCELDAAHVEDGLEPGPLGAPCGLEVVLELVELALALGDDSEEGTASESGRIAHQPPAGR